MKSTNSTSAINLRRFRERQKERGLIKREVWIRPEHAESLSLLEKGMREHGWAGAKPTSLSAAHQEAWTLGALEQALMASPLVTEGHVSLEHLEGAEPSLRLTLHDRGDLNLLLALSGEQILVEAYLWPVSVVKDPDAFNVFLLKTHKYLPLSSFSLGDVGGVASYTLFGSLSALSPLSTLLLEIESLADNVLDVVQACEDAGLLNPSVEEAP